MQRGWGAGPGGILAGSWNVGSFVVWGAVSGDLCPVLKANQLQVGDRWQVEVECFLHILVTPVSRHSGQGWPPDQQGPWPEERDPW